MKTIATVIAVAAAAGFAAAECPNSCSGHGACGANDACDCYNNWLGADCSERVCPFGLAFVDAPRGDLNHDGVIATTKATGEQKEYETQANRRDNLLVSPTGLVQVQWSNKLEYEYYGFHSPSTASTGVMKVSSTESKGYTRALNEEGHYYNECSGKGLCDREAGLCQCFDGYTGAACERSTCPNDCSGHGSCLTVRELALGDRVGGTAGRNYRDIDYYNGYTVHSGVSAAFYYNLWDAEKNQACACDAGYFGPDCSQRECPRGNDPLTNEWYHCGNAECSAEVQYMYIGLNGAPVDAMESTLRFSYTDKYSGDTTYYSDYFTIDVYDAANSEARTARDLKDKVQAALNTFPKNVLGDVTVSIAGVFDASAGSVASHLASSTRLGAADDFVELKIDFANGPQGDVNAIKVDSVTYSSKDGDNSEKVSLITTHLVGTTNTVASVDSPHVAAPACNVGKSVGNGANCDLDADVAGFNYANASPKNGNTEYSPCSNRGVCDHDAGQCQCFTGYSGAACNVQAALAQ